MNRYATLVSVVSGSLAAYLIYQSCKSNSATCPDHDTSAQTDCFPQYYGASLQSSPSNDPKTQDAASLATYPDSIWGRFRAENNDRFNEILHGFETKGALAPIDLFVCDENGETRERV